MRSWKESLNVREREGGDEGRKRLIRFVPSLPLLSCESSVSVKKTLTEKNQFSQYFL